MPITLTNILDLAAVIEANLGYAPTDSLVAQTIITSDGQRQVGPLARLTVTREDRAQALEAILDFLKEIEGGTIEDIFIGLYQEGATIEDAQELELYATAAGFRVKDFFVMSNGFIMTEGQTFSAETAMQTAFALDLQLQRKTPAVPFQKSVDLPDYTKKLNASDYEPAIHSLDDRFEALKKIAEDNATQNDIEFIAAAFTHEEVASSTVFLAALAMLKKEEANDEAAQEALGFTAQAPDVEAMIYLAEKLNSEVVPYVPLECRAGIYELNIWSSWLACRNERMQSFIEQYDESKLEKLFTPLLQRVMIGDYPQYTKHQQQR